MLDVGCSNAEKWGDHGKKNSFINNTIEAIIPLNTLGAQLGPVYITMCTSFDSKYDLGILRRL